MLLLVTNKRDITTDYVVAEIRRRGLSYFRLNTEDLPRAIFAMDAVRRDNWSFRWEDQELFGSKVRAAYFRRPGAPVLAHVGADSGEVAYSESEWQSLLKSLYSRLDGRWLSSPTSIFMAEDKPRQLLLAHEIGLNIPQTTVTNEYSQVMALSKNGAAVAKPLRNALLTGSEERVMFTTRLSDVTSADAAAIAVAPIICQTEVKKRFDVRVTVVADKVFAAAIHSQDFSETEVDWRKGSRPDLRHECVSLPEDLEAKCIELTTRLGLRYGAIDLVCDEAGVFWFLEINPNGQWAWIENMTGYPIASAIVDALEVIADENACT